MTSQDALIAWSQPQAAPTELEALAVKHVTALREAGRLTSGDEVTAALFVHLARITGRTATGYAAANLARELRETIAALPVWDAEGTDDLAEYLTGLS